MRTRRLAAGMAAEADALPDPWALAADIVRAELEQRSRRPPEALRGLSADALAVLGYLHGLEHGRTFLERLEAIVPGGIDVEGGLSELYGWGLLEITMAHDEEGEPAEAVISLRYDVELPPEV